MLAGMHIGGGCGVIEAGRQGKGRDKSRKENEIDSKSLFLGNE